MRNPSGFVSRFLATASALLLPTSRYRRGPSNLAAAFPLSSCRSNLPSAVRRFSSSSEEEEEFPIDVLETGGGLDWDDRIALQAAWTNEEKGWRVAVEWRPTPFGAGLFAARDVPAGTVLRVGKAGRNLMAFRTADDIEAFCRRGGDDDDDGSAEYRSRLRYAADYLWGFSPTGTDPRGYDVAPPASRFFGMWIPGNGLNHSPNPNTAYRTRPGGAHEDGIDLVSIEEIKAGDELFDDYRRHGRAPEWLLEFAEAKQVTLNFAECNDFVSPGDEKEDK